MIYIHLNKGELNMYIHVTFERESYENYTAQANTHIQEFLKDGWVLVSIICRIQQGGLDEKDMHLFSFCPSSYFAK